MLIHVSISECASISANQRNRNFKHAVFSLGNSEGEAEKNGQTKKQRKFYTLSPSQRYTTTQSTKKQCLRAHLKPSDSTPDSQTRTKPSTAGNHMWTTTNVSTLRVRTLSHVRFSSRLTLLCVQLTGLRSGIPKDPTVTLLLT